MFSSTTINLMGSKDLNKRGHNADNIFSPLHVGSRATSYAWRQEGGCSSIAGLATAMATSGAAASANMGTTVGY